MEDGLAVGQLHGFDVYVSSNLPSVGIGPATSGSANQNSNYGAIVGGHSSAVATALKLIKLNLKRSDWSLISSENANVWKDSSTWSNRNS